MTLLKIDNCKIERVKERVFQGISLDKTLLILETTYYKLI